MLALGLIAVAVLSLVALSLSTIRSSRKSGDVLIGQMVADQQVEKLAYEAETVTGGSFWSFSNTATPYATDVATVSATEFRVALYASDVVGMTTPGQRLKKVRALVTWWDTSQNRQGYGQMRASASRVVHEP